MELVRSGYDFERCLGRKNHKTWAMGGLMQLRDFYLGDLGSW